MSKQYTRLRPHWRPTHDATPHGFDRWIGPDGSNGWAKILNPDGHLVRRVWEMAPQANIMLRNHSISEQKSELLADPVGTARAHVDFWRSWCGEQGLSYSASRIFFEGINEAPIWEEGYTEALDLYTEELLYYGSTFVMSFGALQINTGWPTNHGVEDAPPDWSGFERTRVALQKTGCYLCLHEYWDIRGPASDDWGWNPGRFTQLPDSWRGIPILITECGYDAAVNAPAGTENHGWLGKLDKQAYMAHLAEYDHRLRHSDWDVHAAFVFTHDWDKPWSTFDTVPLLEDLIGHAAEVRALPITSTPPVPPPTTRPPVSEEVEVMTLLYVPGGIIEGYLPLPLAQGIADNLVSDASVTLPEAIDVVDERDDYARRTTIRTESISAIEYELPS